MLNFWSTSLKKMHGNCNHIWKQNRVKHTQTHTPAYTCARAHTHTRVIMHTHTWVYIHTYTHTHTSVHTHTQSAHIQSVHTHTLSLFRKFTSSLSSSCCLYLSLPSFSLLPLSHFFITGICSMTFSSNELLIKLILRDLEREKERKEKVQFNYTFQNLCCGGPVLWWGVTNREITVPSAERLQQEFYSSNFFHLGSVILGSFNFIFSSNLFHTQKKVACVTNNESDFYSWLPEFYPDVMTFTVDL